MSSLSITEFLAFQNPGTPEKIAIQNPVTVASAIAHPAPTALITTVSGTAEMTTIGLPWTGFCGFVVFLPTGAFTGATGGTATATAAPIGKAFTAVAGKALIMFYSQAANLWYPCYTS